MATAPRAGTAPRSEFDPISAAVAAGKIGTAIAGVGSGIKTLFGGGRKGPKLDSKFYQRYQDFTPNVGLTPADYAAAEETRGRLNRSVAAAGRAGRGQIRSRYLSRGLAGSPAEETSIARVGEQEALGRELAASSAEQQLYNIRLGRESAAYNRAAQIFSAQTGQAYANQARSDLQYSTFLNSLLEYMPGLLAFLNQGNTDLGTGDFLPVGNQGEPAPNYG